MYMIEILAALEGLLIALLVIRVIRLEITNRSLHKLIGEEWEPYGEVVEVPPRGRMR